MNLTLLSAVSPSISGEWQQFTLSGSGVSCWGDVISQGQRTRKGGSRQGAKPPCTRNGPSLRSVPGGKEGGASEAKEQ